MKRVVNKILRKRILDMLLKKVKHPLKHHRVKKVKLIITILLKKLAQELEVTITVRKAC